MADHVTQFKHPEDPRLGFLTTVAVEAVKEKEKRLDCPPGKLLDVQSGHIVMGMNTRKDLNTVFKDRSSKNEREIIFY